MLTRVSKNLYFKPNSAIPVQKRFKPIAMYNFNRFNNSYNWGKPLQLPDSSMEVTPYIRQELGETDEEVWDRQLSQVRAPLQSWKTFMPNANSPRDIPSFDSTLHAESTLLGLVDNNGQTDRYFLKFFGPEHIPNARREVLFSYLLAETGEGISAPQVSHFEMGDRQCVMRKFYEGVDGRCLMEDDETTPESVSLDGLVKNYALRYVLFGDCDFENPGNVIFSAAEKGSSSNMVNIDGEYILADENLMENFEQRSWEKGDPIPGSLKWRRQISEFQGPETFFEMMVSGSNPMLTFLRKFLTLDEMKQMVLPRSLIHNCLNGWTYFEQLVRTFEVLPLEMLEKAEADFQQVLKMWELKYLNNDPLTLYNLVTGVYE